MHLTPQYFLQDIARQGKAPRYMTSEQELPKVVAKLQQAKHFISVITSDVTNENL